MSAANPPTIALTHAVREVTEQAQRERHLQVRVLRRDGTEVLGHFLLLQEDAILVMVGADDEVHIARAGAGPDADFDITILVPLSEVQSIFVGSPNRTREGLLAVGGIIGTVSLLTLYSAFPWVHPERGDMTAAFTVLVAGAVAVFSLPQARTKLKDWLVRWRQAYPPP